MQSTSVAYQTAVVQPSRSSVAKILFGVYDVTAATDSALVSNASQTFSRVANIVADVRNQEYKAASFEDNYFKLDGGMYLMPDEANADQDILGWWSQDMSGSDRSLLTAKSAVKTDTAGYVDCGNKPDYQFTNAFTLECWLYVDSFNTGNMQVVAKELDFKINFNITTGMLGAIIATTGTPWGTATVLLPNTTVCPIGEWVHAAVVYNVATGLMTLYQNGIRVYEIAYVGNFATMTTNTLAIGSNTTGSAAGPAVNRFLGKVRDVRLWNVARTVAQISEFSGETLFGSEAGLVGYWKCNEGTGTNVVDYARGNNGTYISGTWFNYNQYPTLTATFKSLHTSVGFGVFFGSDEYCTDFDITFFNANTQVGYTSVTGNTLQDVNIAYSVTNYNKIVIRLLKTKNPYRYARMMELQFGLETVFDSDLLTAATVVEEVDPSNAALSFNTLKFTVLNLDQRFNMLNPTGIFAFLQKRQKIVARSGLLVGDNYEWVDMGTYYLSDWKNSTNITASLEATDAIGLLDKTVYRSSPYWVNAPVETVLRHILNDAGSFSLQISPSAASEVINGYIPVKSHRAALADVLVASRNVMRTERSGILNVTKANYVTTDATVDYNTMINSPSIEQKPLISSVEAKEFSYVLDSVTTQLTQATFPLTGTNTVTIDYGCAASNPSVVLTRKVRYIRDWLNGSNANGGNHWIEIQAINLAGTNVALGKSVSGSIAVTGAPYVTDGDISTAVNYASQTGGLNYVVVDLGAVNDISSVKVWHFWNDLRSYWNTKTEVSEDGVTWYTLFDSAGSNVYPESAAGRTYQCAPIIGTPVYSAVSVSLQISSIGGNVTATVNGRKYIETSRPVTSSVALAAGDVPQTATISENKMIVGNGTAVSAYILAYFQKRISQKFDYWSNPAIQSGDNISVQTMFGTSYGGMLERQEITIAPNLKARLEVTG